MGALSTILRSLEGNRVAFWCPGCDLMHAVHIGDGPPPRWTWNGDAGKPTFQPSILVHYDHWEPPAEPGKPAPASQRLVKSVCHSFVTAGRIQFLTDSTHTLSGRTVDIPPWDGAF